MSDQHKGPHCAGLCEGAAYTAMLRQKDKRIESLEAESGERLVELGDALKDARALADWVLNPPHPLRRPAHIQELIDRHRTKEDAISIQQEVDRLADHMQETEG